MPLEWLNAFHHVMKKRPDYAARTLAAYALGMKAHGAIVGVSVQLGARCCEAARRLPAGEIYQPADAPRLPLPDCPLGACCECVYRPVMSYQRGERE
jgi:hypothetical protein